MATPLQMFRHMVLLPEGTLRDSGWCSLNAHEFIEHWTPPGSEVVSTETKTMTFDNQIIAKINERRRQRFAQDPTQGG